MAEQHASPVQVWGKRLILTGLLVFTLVGVGVALAFAGAVSRMTEQIPLEGALKGEDVPDRKGDPEAIARGEYLVNNVMACKVCHGEDLGGHAEVDDPAFGRFWGGNLTSGEGSVVKDYTMADWDRAIRHGLDPEGRRLLLMPSEDYYNFSAEDLAAAVAWIASQPAVDRADEGITLRPVGAILVATGEFDFAFNKIDHDAPRPDAWGKVLAGTCKGCHGGGYSGGAIPGVPPDWPEAANLTPHETGLKAWSYDQFTTLMRTGERPDGSAVHPTSMPWENFKGMKEADLKALWGFLQSLEPKAAGGR